MKKFAAVFLFFNLFLISSFSSLAAASEDQWIVISQRTFQLPVQRTESLLNLEK